MCRSVGIFDEAAGTPTPPLPHTHTPLCLRPLLSEGRQCEHTARRGDRATACPAACQLRPRAALTRALRGAHSLHRSPSIAIAPFLSLVLPLSLSLPFSISQMFLISLSPAAPSLLSPLSSSPRRPPLPPLALSASPREWVTSCELLWGYTQIKSKECAQLHTHRHTRTHTHTHTHTHISLGITSTVTQRDTSSAIPVSVRGTHTPHTECRVTISLSILPLMPVCLVTHCNGTQHAPVCVCDCVCVCVWERERERERNKDVGVRLKRRARERRIEKVRVCAWRAYVCVCVRGERYCVSQCVVSGLAVWADTDYSLHGSPPSQATIATAKALYFKKLKHCARSRIPLMPPAVRPLASRNQI